MVRERAVRGAIGDPVEPVASPIASLDTDRNSPYPSPGWKCELARRKKVRRSGLCRRKAYTWW
jgi:hypothetical protein